MKIRILKTLFLATMLLAIGQSQNATTQQVLGNGELLINLLNAPTNWDLYVDAVTTTWGSKNQSYPVLTNRYLHYHLSYGNIPNFDAIDDQNAAPAGQVVAYGRYRIKIEGNSVYVDYRDCDYFGKGNIHYNRGSGHDINISYDFNTHSFTYMSPSSGNIWDNRDDAPNHSIYLFKIPVTATNNFSGGEIKMDGATYSTPKTLNWGWTTTHTITAITLQFVGGKTYSFRKWSDGYTQTSRSLTIDDRHNSYSFTANFWNAYMSGPTYLDPYEVGTFTANPSGGVTPYDYTWYRMEGGEPESLRGDVQLFGPPSGVWIHLSQFDGSRTATSSGVYPGFKMQVSEKK